MHDTLLAIDAIPCYTLSTTRQLLAAAADAFAGSCADAASEEDVFLVGQD